MLQGFGFQNHFFVHGEVTGDTVAIPERAQNHRRYAESSPQLYTWQNCEFLWIQHIPQLMIVGCRWHGWMFSGSPSHHLWYHAAFQLVEDSGRPSGANWRLQELEFLDSFKWVFPEMGVITPKWRVYKGKSYENMDDLGIPPFIESLMSRNPGNFNQVEHLKSNQNCALFKVFQSGLKKTHIIYIYIHIGYHWMMLDGSILAMCTYV